MSSRKLEARAHGYWRLGLTDFGGRRGHAYWLPISNQYWMPAEFVACRRRIEAQVE